MGAVLWVRRHLQPAPARGRRAAGRTQGGQPEGHRGRGDRRRQPGSRAADRQAPGPPDLPPDDPARHVPPRSETVSKAQAAAPPTDAAAQILTDEAIAFIGELQERFGARRTELLAARKERAKPS